MRIAAIVVALTLSPLAQAQVANAPWGGAPRPITFTPIDTSKAIGASHLSSAFKSPSAPIKPAAGLSNLFPTFSLQSFPPKTPQVSVLPQKQNPFQPNPIKGGVNPLNPKKK